MFTRAQMLLGEATCRNEVKRLECGLLLGCGVSEDSLVQDRRYGEIIVTTARRRRINGLHALIGEYLKLEQIPFKAGGSNLFRAIPMGRQARELREINAGGYSTLDLPGILGNVASKILLDAFTSVDSTYDRLAQQADFSSFHTHTMYRLDHMGDFEVIPPTGELKHGWVSEESYTNKLDTRGQILTLDRRDIINDDLQAFVSLPQQLGRKARIAVEKAFITAVMEVSDSFYTTARGNKLTGQLGITELAAAEAAMASMVDANGDPIFAMPRYLFVPPELKVMAQELFTSEFLQGAVASDLGQPSRNTFRFRFEPVVSPYLSNPNIPGSSRSTWYLLSDPNLLAAYQVAFLNGLREPTIETADAEFSTLGLQMRAIFDFGVAKLDPRGAIKSVNS